MPSSAASRRRQHDDEEDYLGELDRGTAHVAGDAAEPPATRRTKRSTSPVATSDASAAARPAASTATGVAIAPASATIRRTRVRGTRRRARACARRKQHDHQSRDEARQLRNASSSAIARPSREQRVQRRDLQQHDEQQRAARARRSGCRAGSPSRRARSAPVRRARRRCRDAVGCRPPVSATEAEPPRAARGPGWSAAFPPAPTPAGATAARAGRRPAGRTRPSGRRRSSPASTRTGRQVRNATAIAKRRSGVRSRGSARARRARNPWRAPRSRPRCDVRPRRHAPPRAPRPACQNDVQSRTSTAVSAQQRAAKRRCVADTHHEVRRVRRQHLVSRAAQCVRERSRVGQQTRARRNDEVVGVHRRDRRGPARRAAHGPRRDVTISIACAPFRCGDADSRPTGLPGSRCSLVRAQRTQITLSGIATVRSSGVRAQRDVKDWSSTNDEIRVARHERQQAHSTAGTSPTGLDGMQKGDDAARRCLRAVRTASAGSWRNPLLLAAAARDHARPRARPQLPARRTPARTAPSRRPARAACADRPHSSSVAPLPGTTRSGVVPHARASAARARRRADPDRRAPAPRIARATAGDGPRIDARADVEDRRGVDAERVRLGEVEPPWTRSPEQRPAGGVQWISGHHAERSRRVRREPSPRRRRGSRSMRRRSCPRRAPSHRRDGRHRLLERHAEQSRHHRHRMARVSSSRWR